jgi:cell division protein FtsZ
MELPANAFILLIAAAAAVLALVLVLAKVRSARRHRDRRISVVGIGEGGANAVEAMIRAGMRGVEFVVLNTDARALSHSSAKTKIVMGRGITGGLGAGGDVSVGEAAARDAADEIGIAIERSQLVVLAAGLGGGTGSGALPVVAEVARKLGALTMAVVTTPFAFEGTRRRDVAARAASALAGKVDAVATVPNDRVREVMPVDVTVDDAFRAIDDVMQRSVTEILGLIAAPGRISLDFADVRAVLQGGGAAAVGFGRAAGEHRATEAARRAVAATHLEGRMKAATSVLVNVSGSRKLRLAELDAVTETVLSDAGRDANLVFGMTVDRRLRDEVQVTVIATGFDGPRRDDARADDATGSGDPAWRPVWLRRADDAAMPRAHPTTGARPRRRRASEGTPPQTEGSPAE